MSMTSPARYTPVAIVLHWLLALAIIGAFCMGVYMSDLPFSPTRLKLYNWHKWAGVAILALSAGRLLWRLTHRPPADAPMPAWQARVAHGVHLLLYVAFFAVPLTGWAMSSAKGYPIVWFGVLPLPDFVPKDHDLGELLEQVHAALAWGLAVLVIAHVAGALKHHFIDRDGLLKRMSLRG
jgi:cytochrome b561